VNILWYLIYCGYLSWTNNLLNILSITIWATLIILHFWLCGNITEIFGPILKIRGDYLWETRENVKKLYIMHLFILSNIKTLIKRKRDMLVLKKKKMKIVSWKIQRNNMSYMLQIYFPTPLESFSLAFAQLDSTIVAT